MNGRSNRANGFTLITTLFLLVVVSALAGYLVNLATAQHFSSALTISALRARHAALGGIEWVAYRINNVANTCPPVPTTLAIDGFNVSLTNCSASIINEGSISYRMYDVTVRAERGTFGDADYVNLAIRATLRG
jgi:MSHA biogenesis protein MshP